MSDSQRLRALRDRINLRGRSELSFEEKVRCIGEVISTFSFTSHNWMYVRKYLVKLKIRYPDLTDDQKVLLAGLENRFTKREAWIKERSEKKKRGEKLWSRKKQESVPAPSTDLLKLWGEALNEENNSGNVNTIPKTD